MGFELTISAGERSQTYALDLTNTGTGFSGITIKNNVRISYFPP